MGLNNYKAYELRDVQREQLKDMEEQIQDQDRERSKREDCFEDFKDLGHEMTTIPLSDECWCVKCEQPNFVIRSKQMRCSEQSGNRLRDK